jgi:hypothetical protein
MTKLEKIKAALDAACEAADAARDDAYSDAWDAYQNGLKKLQEERPND